MVRCARMTALRILLALCRRPYRRAGARASACLGDDAQRARLCARRQRHRHPPTLGVRRHVFGLRDAGPGEQGQGHLHAATSWRRSPRSMSSRSRNSITSPSPPPTATRRRSAIRCRTTSLDYKDSVLTLHFTLPFKTPVKAKLLKIDIYDADHFRRFRLRQGQAGLACRRAGRLQARRGAAARDDLRGRQGAERHPRRPAQHD